MKKEIENVVNIPPQSGVAFKIKKGQFLKVICPEGGQVADMTAHNADNFLEVLSNGKTLDYEETLRLTEGNTLYSNMSNPMMEIIEDTCGVHDFLLAPCCEKTMKHFYGMEGENPNCADNLYNALKKYEIEKSSIPTAFNIFMNVVVSEDLKISVEPPLAKPGDYIIFKAAMDMIIGLTSCSAGASNGYAYKEIQYMVDDIIVGSL